MSKLNEDTYNAAGVLKWYATLSGLVPAEQLIFEIHAQTVAEARLLDLGIGGGRTTRYLLGHCKTYTGIDYSPGFVAQAKRLYPTADLRLADARRLDAFADHSFAVVNFSFNGMDYVDLEGRKQILQEVHRVLQPGGLFFFSTHNKSHPDFNRQPWLIKTTTPFVRLKTWLKLLPYRLRHAANRRHELHAPEYAVINDSAHHYGLMTFYTTPEFLSRQLQEHHFSEPEFYSDVQKETDHKKLGPWIFASCSKLPA